ncbi:LLM class flavin-dependent oxidoreductase [Yinghuangia aomiensis]
MKFATGTTIKNFDSYAAWLDVAADCGYAMLTTGDSQSLWADPYVSLAFAAQRTTTQRLGITVSNPKTRHPAVAASAASALQHISGGRFVLGIASGDSALRNIGVRPGTVDETETYVRTIRALTRGDHATWQGTDLVQRWAPAATPVWMAAEGPRTLRAAGRQRGRRHPVELLTPEAYTRNLAQIAEGAAEVGRTLADLEIWCVANVVPAATEAEGIAQVRSILAGTANHVGLLHHGRQGPTRRVGAQGRGAQAPLRLHPPRLTRNRGTQRRPRCRRTRLDHLARRPLHRRRAHRSAVPTASPKSKSRASTTSSSRNSSPTQSSSCAPSPDKVVSRLA